MPSSPDTVPRPTCYGQLQSTRRRWALSFCFCTTQMNPPGRSGVNCHDWLLMLTWSFSDLQIPFLNEATFHLFLRFQWGPKESTERPTLSSIKLCTCWNKIQLLECTEAKGLYGHGIKTTICWIQLFFMLFFKTLSSHVACLLPGWFVWYLIYVVVILILGRHYILKCAM